MHANHCDGLFSMRGKDHFEKLQIFYLKNKVKKTFFFLLLIAQRNSYIKIWILIIMQAKSLFTTAFLNSSASTPPNLNNMGPLRHVNSRLASHQSKFLSVKHQIITAVIRDLGITVFSPSAYITNKLLNWGCKDTQGPKQRVTVVRCKYIHIFT